MLVIADKSMKHVLMEWRGPQDCLHSAGSVSEVGTPQTLDTLQNLLGLSEVTLKLNRAA